VPIPASKLVSLSFITASINKSITKTTMTSDNERHSAAYNYVSTILQSNVSAVGVLVIL
jgi:hypothetical protein